MNLELEEELAKELALLNYSIYEAGFNGTLYGNHSYYGRRDTWLSVVTNIIQDYVLPIIILVGIVGNSISFLVFISTPRLCRQTSSVYLAFLAAVDNLFLVTVFFTWCAYIGINVFFKNGWCQTILYCTYVCSFLAVWTVVSFTIERWIVVFHPLRRHSLCTRRRAIIVMTCLTISALIFYSFAIFTTTVLHDPKLDLTVCSDDTDYRSALQVIRSLDTMITIVIPCLAIIVMNTGIGIKTCRYANKKKTLQVPMDSVDDFSGFTSVNRQSETRQGHPSAMSLVSNGQRVQVNSKQGPRSWRVLTRRRHTQLRITRALLIVSSVFVLLNIPNFAFRIHAFIIAVRIDKLEEGMERLEEEVINAKLWLEIISFFYYTNFASRFFIYTASSRNFRYALRRLFIRLKHRLSKIFSLAQGQHLQNYFQARL